MNAFIAAEKAAARERLKERLKNELFILIFIPILNFILILILILILISILSARFPQPQIPATSPSYRFWPQVPTNAALNSLRFQAPSPT